MSDTKGIHVSIFFAKFPTYEIIFRGLRNFRRQARTEKSADAHNKISDLWKYLVDEVGYCVAGSVATDGVAGWPLIIHITAIIIRSPKARRWSVYASNQVEENWREEGCYCGNFWSVS